jgi:8-oxo-dGTP diphosphatase
MQRGVDFVGIAVTYFCHDGKGNILFQKRSKNCRDEQGRWDIGGGALEFGDTVIDTLKREITEEYSTDVLDYEFLGYRDVHRELDGKKNHWTALNFKVLVDKEKVKNGEPHKFDEIGWFNLNNLPSPLHSQVTNEIDLYKDKLKDVLE